MAEETNVTEYLAVGGATESEINDFLDWCMVMCIQPGGNGDEKRRLFWCYRMWARLLRKRRTPFPSDGKFTFDECLKKYMRHLTGGDITDAPNPLGAIYIRNKDFVKYVVRYVDDAY